MVYDVENVTREKQLNIRLSAEEELRLDRVAAHYGLNAAGLFRMLLKREDDGIVRDEARRDNTRWLSFVDEAEKAVKATGVRGLHLVENRRDESIQVNDGSRGKIVRADDFYEELVSWPGSKLADYEWDYNLREFVKLKKPRKR